MTDRLGLDSVGKRLSIRFCRTCTYTDKLVDVVMVIKAPKGRLALFKPYNYDRPGSYDRHGKAIKAFMDGQK